MQKSLQQLPELAQTDEGLQLVYGDMVLQGNFAPLLKRVQPHALKQELLIKAAKGKNGQCTGLAADATAGLGEDAFLLAAAGYEVALFERNPLIAALLQDALHQAQSHPRTKEIAKRMQLKGKDSIEELARLDEQPALVYLDPMFPPKQKSGAHKKKLQMLQMLEAPCTDAEQLFDAALATLPKRIVIKRPLKGAYLANRKPSYSVWGNIIRYDVYVL